MAPPRRPKSAPRAPRRQGERTTLRVPPTLAESIERFAEEHSTSTNDALVRLAYAGAEAYDREREIAALAAVRREAILRPLPVPPGTPMPSAEETTEAILAFRLGLIDEEEWGA